MILRGRSAREVRRCAPADDAPFAVGEFIAHDSKLRFGTWNHIYANGINTPSKFLDSAAKQT